MSSEQQTAPEDKSPEMRAKCRAIIEAEGLTMRRLANESNIPYGTFSSWLNETYAGRNDKIAAAVELWLASRTERRAAVKSVPRTPEFLATPSAMRIHNALRMAQVLPDIAAVIGAPGTGKTSAALEYRARNPHVIFMTAHPGVSRSRAVMRALAQDMRCLESAPDRIFTALKARFSGTQTLIIVDEAQHLELKAFEQLRAFHDLGIGLAFMGNEVIHGVLSGGRGGSEQAQLSSRFGFRVIQQEPDPGDVEMLINGWGVQDDAERDFLATVAKKPGGLRVMTKVIRLASLIAGASREERAIGHFRAAWDQQTRAPRAAS